MQVAVSLFKAGLTLELTRRENDDKVIALNLTMCDMMQVLTMYVFDSRRYRDWNLLTGSQTEANRGSQGAGTRRPHHRRPPEAAHAHDRRLDQTVRQSLRQLPEATYRRYVHTWSLSVLFLTPVWTALPVKFFTSLKWQAKFTDVAQQFADHKTAIQSDLQIHASVRITTISVNLSALSAAMDRFTENVGKLMEVVFERMRSPEEREVASLVEAQPGGDEAALKNDVLLEKVLAAQKSNNGKGAGARRHGGGSGAEEDKTKTISELRLEVGKDVEQVLADNKYFEQKFEVVRMQVDEVKVSIKRETDRVIDAVLSGPHERIIDRVSLSPWCLCGLGRQ